MDERVSAREWGRLQARSSPPWPEEKWRRIGAIFGVDFVADAGSERVDGAAKAGPDAA